MERDFEPINDIKKIFEQAKNIIVDKDLLFVDDIIALLPISKPTFYRYFPLDSPEMDKIKELLNENKVNIKSGLREKWYNSDNATTQLALYKLCSTTEEHRKLNQNYTDVTTDGETIKVNNDKFDEMRKNIKL